MIAPIAEIGIPKSAEIDYSNIAVIEGYAFYLMKLYEQEGGFRLPSRITRLMKVIEAELRVWCNNVKQLLPTVRLCDFKVLINVYDMAYRVVHQEAPSQDFMRKLRLDSVQRWATGDKSITATGIAEILWDEVYNRSFRTLDNKYGLFYFGLIDSWVVELQRNGKFAGISREEIFSRLALLMTEDLFAQYGSKGASKDKLKWLKAHEVSDVDALDTPTLKAYIKLIDATVTLKGTDMSDHFAEIARLHTILASRTDLHPYYRAALTLDVALKQTLIQELAG